VTWDIDRIMRWAAFGLFCFTAGTAVDFKFYRVQGLWGVQNQERHLTRVVVPQLKTVATKAASACEHNAKAALNNDAKIGEVKACPEAAKVVAVVAK
jgi:hypothetical protein